MRICPDAAHKARRRTLKLSAGAFMSTKQFTANDNAPDASGTHIGFGTPSATPGALRHSRLTERPSMIISQTPSRGDYSPVWTPKLQRAKPRTPKPASGFTYALTAMVWTAAILANVAAILFAPANTVHLCIVIAAIWASLAMVYIAQSRGQTYLAEMASLAVIAAFGLSIYVTSMRFGITSGPATGAALGAFASAGLGLITGSKLALRISAFAALTWAAITLTGPSLNYGALLSGVFPKPGPAWLTFPALLAFQTYAMSRHRDGPALAVSIIAAYILAAGGLAGLVVAGQLSPVLAAGGLMLAGLAHNRAGKVMGAKQAFGSALHNSAGTAAMLTGLIALQDFWTSPARALWSDAAATGTQWAGGLAAGGVLLILIFSLEIARARLSLSRTAGAVFMAAIAGGAAYLSARPQILSAPLSDYGLSVTPFVGIAIAGTVLAIGLGLLANGFRRQIIGFVALGALAISGNVFLALPAIIAALPEAGPVYAISAFVSGLIGASFITMPDNLSPRPFAPNSYVSAND